MSLRRTTTYILTVALKGVLSAPGESFIEGTSAPEAQTFTLFYTTFDSKGYSFHIPTVETLHHRVCSRYFERLF